MIRKGRQLEEDRRVMHHTSDELVAERKKQGKRGDSKDLLDLMLWARDPQTGEGLSDENIRFQMVTFLIAGHETTSGLLSFALYELLNAPHTLAKAQAEVDRVLGNQNPRFEHLAQLGYIDQVLKEALRLWPTAPMFAVYPRQGETTIGGGYPVNQKQNIFVLLPTLHRDPKVWGDDPERFDPEHFAPEAFEKLPPNSWKAFGNGQRACIGRPFAMQEAIIVLATVLQRFDLSKADPAYDLKIKQTLTLKPDGFFIKAKRRNIAIVQPAPATPRAAAAAQPAAQTAAPDHSPAGVIRLQQRLGRGVRAAHCRRREGARLCVVPGHPGCLGGALAPRGRGRDRHGVLRGTADGQCPAVRFLAR